MLDLFASVGVAHFDITHTNLDGTKRGFRPKQSMEQARRSMPFLLRSAPIRQNNVIIRPHHPPAVVLVQLDDLATAAAAQLCGVAFLTIQTNPGNAQAWIAVETGPGSLESDFARRLRKGAGADPSASGTTRIAGTANFKRKYEPDFPTVAITSAQPGRTVTASELDAMGLVAAPEPTFETQPLRVSRRSRGRGPDYQYCVERAPLAWRRQPDISRADFAWCMTAIDWGWSISDVAERLMDESAKAQENGYDYALTTARNAAAAVERRHGRGAEP